jgi:hypothetical protein
MTSTPKARRRRTTKTQDETLASWEALSTTAKAQLADNPQAASDQAALEAIIGQVKAANVDQDALNAKLRDSIRSRKEMTAQGSKLRSRLVAHLQSKFGPDSEMLREFGLRPKSLRRKTASPPTENPTTPAAGGTATAVQK